MSSENKNGKVPLTSKSKRVAASIMISGIKVVQALTATKATATSNT